MKQLRWLCLWLFLAIPQAWAAQPTITCSFSIPADWVKNLCGQDVKIQTLAGPNTDLHEFQPGPAAARAILSADLIVGIDPLLEPWLNELVISNKLSDKVIWLGKAWISAHEGHKHHSHICEADPHIWTDPEIVQAMVEKLAAACAQLKGVDQTKLASQKDAYLKSIQALHRSLSAEFAKIPADRRVVVTHHNNFSRFAERYGIKVAGVILDSATTEAADPSAKRLAKLIQQVRAERVSLIICDRGERAPAAELLARETGLPPPISINLDSLDKQGTRGDSWLGMMNEIAAALINPWKEMQ